MESHFVFYMYQLLSCSSARDMIDYVYVYDHAMYVYHHNSTCCAVYVYAF